MGAPYGFSRSRRGAIRLHLDEIERALLISLAHQMMEFVAPAPADPDADPLAALVGIDEVAQVPDDPALARLLPDAFLDDAEAAGEFRRFTERSLRETKVAHATLVAAALESGETAVPDDAAAAWLGFLNDARLALGTRLDISEDNQAELAGLPEDDPRAGMFHVYDWLTYLQDSLVNLLMP
ncbi:MAG: DUF2017 domain-containing protein [Actinobacteria bacterium]|jgi:hypothetical protein|nr:DUF2017 domain-containing protein [Actinomycetota bacterium]